MNKLLQLSFLPRSTDAALLVTRLFFGLSLVINHGYPKLANFSAMAAGFPDPLGVGGKLSLALALVAEFGAGALLVLGLATRLAALVVVIEMATAFVLVHHEAMTGPMSGELAYLYGAAALALLFAGGGRFAVDGGKSA